MVPTRADGPDAGQQRLPHAVLAVVIALAITAVGALGADHLERSSSGDPPSVAATSAGSSPTAPTNMITIASFKFDPPALAVSPNSEIKITNQDQARHTFTSGTRDNPDGRFDVKIDGGGSGSVPGMPAGSYPYYCAIHPGMKGTVEVKA